MSFIKRANLPELPVKTAIIGKTDEELLSFIRSFGIEVIPVYENRFVEPSISFHADINAFYFGRGEILLDKSQISLFNALKERGMKVEFTASAVSGAYPNDCKLNFALLSDKLIGRIDVADKRIKELPCRTLNVRQGYAKCSTCIVNENAVITDDLSIEKTCIKNGIDVLLIEKGDIYLPAHEYGFIGGASALISKDHMIFFGDITGHRSFDKIDLFMKKHGCRYSYLKNHVLTDIGGIVAVEELQSR